MPSGQFPPNPLRGKRGVALRPNGREVQLVEKIQELMEVGFPDGAIEATLRALVPDLTHRRFLQLKLRARPAYDQIRSELHARLQIKSIIAADEALDRCIQGMRSAKTEVLQCRNAWEILRQAPKPDAPAVTISAQQNYLSVQLVKGDPALIEAVRNAQIAKDKDNNNNGGAILDPNPDPTG